MADRIDREPRKGTDYSKRFMARLEQIPALTGIVVDGRPYSVPAPQ
jgi:hypothetical protein